jgi:hypothetical protein
MNQDPGVPIIKFYKAASRITPPPEDMLSQIPSAEWMFQS